MSLRENGKKIAVYAAQTLVQLLDTNIINKANGDILQYDSTTQKWKNQPTTFTEASSRTNIASGDSISTIFGKIKKFFTDLKTVAFSGSYSDLSNTPTNVSSFTNDSGYLNSGSLGSAVQGLTIASFSGSGSSDQYCLLCELKVAQTYINGASEITISERGRTLCSRISWRFQSVNSTDPNVDSFKVFGDYNDIWIYKSATSTWNIYVRKNENWSSIFVKDCYLYGGYTLTWKMTNASLPSGATQASYGGNVNYANSAGTASNSNACNGYTLGKSVPSNAVFTDTNNAVTQNNTGNDGNYYRILYSVTADDTTRTEGARKGRLLFKPSDVTLQGNDGSQRFLIGNGYMYLAGRSTIINTTQQHLYLRSSSENDYGLYIGIQDNVWAVMPPGKDYMRLGTPNYRWNQIYSSNSAISTSDRKEKKDIVPLDESARTFVMALNPVSYKFKNGNSNRTHYGMIAQDVEDEMEALGMTALDFAGFCKDQKRDVRKVPTPYKDANGNTIFNDMQVDVPGEYTYALRYEEFIGPIIKTEQLQQEDINSLKEEVTLLKEEIALLKQRLQILEDE